MLIFIISWMIVGITTIIFTAYIDREVVTIKDLVIALLSGYIIFIIAFKTRIFDKSAGTIIFDFTKKGKGKGNELSK